MCISDGCAFRMVAANALTEPRYSDYFNRLEDYLGMSRTVILVGDLNAILDERFDCMGVSGRR